MADIDDTMKGMVQRILAVEDDPSLAEMLGMMLSQEGFEVAVVNDGNEALASLKMQVPALVLLDLMLPGVNGIDLCRRIRGYSNVPIIILTAKNDTVDVVLGLEAGADDYVVKPFRASELVARVRAKLRSNEGFAEVLSIGDLQIDLPGHRVSRDGRTIQITPLDFELLVTLARNPRQIFSREMLLAKVWHHRQALNTQFLNTHILRLREKIEKDPRNPQIIVTVRGLGYTAGPSSD